MASGNLDFPNKLPISQTGHSPAKLPPPSKEATQSKGRVIETFHTAVSTKVSETKTYYPSFGEKIQAPPKSSWKKVAKRILFYTLCIATGVGIIPLAIFLIRKYAFHYSLKRSLDGESLPPLSEPRVGKYYKADLCLAKTADEGYTWKKTFIRSAESSIELSVNYAGGKEFQKTLRLIEERLQKKERLRVHLLLNPEFLEPEDETKLAFLQETYKDRFTYLIRPTQVYFSRGPHTEENHVKMLVVDEKYFVSGGTSIQPRLSRETQGGRPDVKTPKAVFSRTLDPSSRDNDIVGESEDVAKVMRRQFFNLFQISQRRVLNQPTKSRFFPFEGTKGKCLAFDKSGPIRGAKMKVIVGGPEHWRDNPITKQYVKRINKAKQSIDLASLEFWPHKTIREALKNKKAIPIRLHLGGTADKSSSGRCMQIYRSRVYYEIPTKVYEYQVKKQMYHKKIAVFDDTHTIIGSYNLGKKSALYDQEMICVVKDKRVAQAVKEVLTEDEKRSREVRGKILEHHTRHKILGAFIKWFEEFV